jgi:hypothetical protein
VSIVRLDDELFRTGERVFLLKIDVEGMEADVIQGASALLRAHRIDNILIEFTDAAPPAYLHVSPVGGARSTQHCTHHTLDAACCALRMILGRAMSDLLCLIAAPAVCLPRYTL